MLANKIFNLVNHLLNFVRKSFCLNTAKFDPFWGMVVVQTGKLPISQPVNRP